MVLESLIKKVLLGTCIVSLTTSVFADPNWFAKSISVTNDTQDPGVYVELVTHIQDGTPNFDITSHFILPHKSYKTNIPKVSVNTNYDIYVNAHEYMQHKIPCQRDMIATKNENHKLISFTLINKIDPASGLSKYSCTEGQKVQSHEEQVSDTNSRLSEQYGKGAKFKPYTNEDTDL